jgi:transposase-like protein
MATILNQPHFQNADKARQYLERIRWPNGPVCPHCGVIDGHYQLNGKAHRKGVWKCHDCREQFTVTVGTVFERSKIALNVWLQAVHFLCSSKKGMSAHQLHRTLGVQYKTAWFMAHRIRKAMESRKGDLLGGGGKIVEADETYFGSEPDKTKKQRGAHHKLKIVALVERGGSIRSFHMPSINRKTLAPLLHGQIDPKTHLMTDSASFYRIPGQEFAKHSTVNHLLGEYSRGIVTTNTVESFFSMLKRGLIGTYHHVGSQHLQRYINEFDFRYNNRTALGVTDAQRTDNALKGIAGKRLTYRRINAQ